MLTTENLLNLIQSLQQMTTLLAIVSSLTILALATAVSSFRSGILRMLFYFGLAAVMFLLATELEGINSEFFLNIGIELLGAVITAILLGSWVTSQRWLFPIIMFISILSTLPIEMADDSLKPFFLNLSTQIVGAFLILILIHKRDWLWDNPKAKARRERQRMHDEITLNLQSWKEKEIEKLRKEMHTEMKSWQAMSQQWDIMLKVGGTSQNEVKTKLLQIKPNLKNIKILEVETDADSQLIHCYMVATVRQGIS
ncbi:MAG: hypothetical protein K8L97_25495 [Anaerolineae bacterium]|nr:hypothetical protein [Anaerolineae bacterium]